MVQPTLLILAAGIGSRYGGLKQLDPIGPSGETIIDYSIYDAMRAGFGNVIFIIKESIEADFKETFVEKLKDKIAIDYVFQETWMVPEGITVPDNRQKPWGTGHAVMMAEKKIKGPFAVINADDFYGQGAFETLASHYRHWEPSRINDYCMVGYPLANTLSEFGAVSRGVCMTNPKGCLTHVEERTHIERHGNEIGFQTESGLIEMISPGTIVSMNFWGFTPSFFHHLRQGFTRFIHENAEKPKAEFYIPAMVNELIQNGTATVQVLESTGQWFGMTYKEDRELVVKKMHELVAAGIYPEKLWV